ncbi:MAG: hypothetical protein J7K87_01840 [Candidatus Aenigmarchaeota archaeon]|nr:hypothetical protein [Candidatus Aenigmarchaeota archaeon]
MVIPITGFGIVDLFKQFFTFFESNGIVTFIIFIIVIYALYKMIKLALRIAMVAVAGMLFPIFMNYFLDWGIPISLNTIIFYATSAVVLYLVAIFVGGILRFFGIFLKPFSESRKIKKIEKDVEKKIEKEEGN